MSNCLESRWPQKILPDSNLRRHRLCLVSLFLTLDFGVNERWNDYTLLFILKREFLQALTFLEIGTFIGAVDELNDIGMNEWEYGI